MKVLAACLALAANLLVSCSFLPSVKIDGERIVGHYEESAATFKGVPYAAAPIGAQRWRAPQAYVSQQKRRDAHEFAPACMQTDRILDWYRDLAETFGAPREAYADLQTSEDCLYLNVWSGARHKSARVPVLVYIHGGSNKSGWSYEPPYHGQGLAADQDVVVVSIAYRVGAFGFLSHPEFDGDAIANFGLWDIVAALEWIQTNIAKFGGDPGRVLVFGESAGAENILALLHTKRARGLLHAAALQSTAGFGIGQPTLEDERGRGAQLGAVLGVQTIDELRAVPADELLRLYTENFPDHYHSPAIDGQLITESTWHGIQHGSGVDVPLVIGSNADEWLSSVAADATAEDVASRAAELRHIDMSVALDAVANSTNWREALDRLYTAELMLCPSQHVAMLWNVNGGRAWNYYFTRVREGDAGMEVGAFHGAEYTYIFGTNYAGMPVADDDRKLEGQMRGYWTSLAATGDPNADSLPEWPRFETQNFHAQELGVATRSIERPEASMCASFDHHFLGHD